MATSGSFTSTFGTSSKYTLKLSWTRNSYDVATNKSNVTVTAYLISGGSSYTINSSVSKSGTLTINGTAYSVSFSCALSGNQTKQIATKTVDIYHNADGTKSFSMSFSGTIGISFSSGYVNTISVSGTGTLDTIPRTSSFSLNTTSGTIGSTQFTVTINRASSSFTHKVIYKFGNINWVGTTNATTSFSFTPAIGDCSEIPNTTVGVGSIQVDTYNGSTYIGSSSQTITLYVPDSVKPSFTSLGADVVASGADASYGYIQGKSKVQLSIWGAAGSYGSSITAYHITESSNHWMQWQVTTGVLSRPGDYTFNAWITDSRGRTSDVKTVTITVKSYSNPVISALTAERCTSDGTLSQNGTYAKVDFSFYGSISDSPLNATLEWQESGTYGWVNCGTFTSNSSAIIGGGSLSIAKIYTIRVTLGDGITSTTREVRISPQFVLLDFKAGGRGMGIGKYATTDNQLEIGMRTTSIDDIEFLNSEKGIGWRMDSDGANIYFHSEGDAGTDNYLCIKTFDNMDEYIYFCHQNSADGQNYGMFMMHPTYGNITYKHFRPSTNNTHDCGTSNQRWRTIYSTNALNVSSDRTLKENIKYLCEVPNTKASKSDELTINDMYDFVKDDLYLTSYNFINDETKDEKLGFIAQDIANTKVGEKIVKHNFDTLGYDSGNFQAVISGALKEEIRIRDKELEEQKQINKQMNEKINELENILKELLDKLN